MAMMNKSHDGINTVHEQMRQRVVVNVRCVKDCHHGCGPLSTETSLGNNCLDLTQRHEPCLCVSGCYK